MLVSNDIYTSVQMGLVKLLAQKYDRWKELPP